MFRTPLPSITIALFLTFAASQAFAGGSEDVGDYVIHYNALPTDQLPPQVASAYGIVRSKNRALLNISVIRKQEGTTGKSTEALVNVSTSNLSGQVKSTRLRKVVEEGETEAIYYIAEINVADGETLIFDVKVTPRGHDQTYTVRFKQQFFAT